MATKNRQKKAQMKSLLKAPEVQTWRAIMSAFQVTLSKLEKGLMEDGLHVSRFQILFYLYFEGSLSAVELSRKLLVTRGNISTFLKRLENDEQIKICSSSPSKGRPLYCLTPSAERFFEEIFPKHVKRVKQYVPRFPKDLQKFLEALSKQDT